MFGDTSMFQRKGSPAALPAPAPSPVKILQQSHDNRYTSAAVVNGVEYSPGTVRSVACPECGSKIAASHAAGRGQFLMGHALQYQYGSGGLFVQGQKCHDFAKQAGMAGQQHENVTFPVHLQPSLHYGFSHIVWRIGSVTSRSGLFLDLM